MSCARLTMVLAGLMVIGAAARAAGAGLYDAGQDHDRLISSVLAEAQSQRKRVFVEVGMSGCPWVRKLDAIFAGDKDIAAALDQGYIHLRLSIYGSEKSKWLKSHLPPLTATPSLFVLDESGRLLYTQDSTPLESGTDFDRGKVKAFLEKWATPDRSLEEIAATQSMMPEIENLESPKLRAAEGPVVVYYYSPRSPEGRELTTTMENISVELAGRAEFFTIDADKAKLEGRPPPRLVLIKNGKRRGMALPGEAREEERLRSRLEAWLSR